jgi:hypothetical protein
MNFELKIQKSKKNAEFGLNFKGVQTFKGKIT